MFTELLLILFLFILIFFACYFTIAFFTGAPFVPTPMSVVSEIISLAKINKKDIVFDLGSGDGRMLIEVAKAGAHSRGWEINPILVVWTKLLAFTAGVSKNVSVYPQTYKKADLHDATVIFLYNLPSFLPFLEEKFQDELKPGTKIFSYKFPLQSLKPIKQTESGIFFYKKT